MDKILILDFGGQSTQLIGRRIRQLGILSEIVPGDSRLEALPLDGTRGIILSGSGYSVYEPGAPKVDLRIYDQGIPILGICYGLQRISADLGGKVESLGRKEFGRARVTLTGRTALFGRVAAESFMSWMSHGDSVTSPPDGFRAVARSDNNIPAAFVNEEMRIWGVQFHPEASHCQYGMEVLEAFASDICAAKREWNMQRFYSEERAQLIRRIGARKVVLLI